MALYKCGDLLKKAFAVKTAFFILSCVSSFGCISMNNQECKSRSKIMDPQ